MEIQHLAAFSIGDEGGNPAGVVLLEDWLSAGQMAQIASQVGYSETAFAVAQKQNKRSWRVRYFSPESEVPFCGHATIALGAVLGKKEGEGKYDLTLNNAVITVEAISAGDQITVTLISPPTRSQVLDKDKLTEALNLFGLQNDDLDCKLPPARIHGGADHILLPLKSRERLAEMDYDIDSGRSMMKHHGLVTIMLVFIEDNQTFVVRNAFASGGVLEDPATGAAAAAFAGYLRDFNWPHQDHIIIRQGEDMGQPSVINVKITPKKGSPVEVSGQARTI